MSDGTNDHGAAITVVNEQENANSNPLSNLSSTTNLNVNAATLSTDLPDPSDVNVNLNASDVHSQQDTANDTAKATVTVTATGTAAPTVIDHQNPLELHSVELHSPIHDQLVVVDQMGAPSPMPVSVPVVPVTTHIDAQNNLVAITDSPSPAITNAILQQDHQHNYEQLQHQHHQIHQPYELIQVQTVEDVVNSHNHNQEHGSGLEQVQVHGGHAIEAELERQQMENVEDGVLSNFELNRSKLEKGPPGMDTIDLLKNAPLATTPEEFDKKYPVEIELMPPSDVPIETPSSEDILFGRGGLTNHHPGNKVYRSLIAAHKADYQNAAKIVKPRVARRIVHAIRHSSINARFLKRSNTDGMWRDVGDKTASEKTSQALREKSAEEKKAQAKAKTSEDSNLPVGYSMPSLAADGTLIAAQTPQMGGMNPAFSPGVGEGQEVNQEGVSTTESASRAESEFALISYPVEGGTFGAVNSDGHIVVIDQDILCGRGGATNHHKGNKRFRDIVALHRPDYVAATKIRKPDVARRIVRAIRMANPPGRFLRKGEDGRWYDVGDKKAAEKASQALREKGPEARKAAKAAAANNAVTTVPVAGVISSTSHFADMTANPQLAQTPAPIIALDTHTPFSLNSKDDLLSGIASSLLSDAKRPAEDDVIISPDAKRLKGMEDASVEEHHV